MAAADRNRRAVPRDDRQVTAALGIDVGGTKIAAGVVDPSTGRGPRAAAGADAPRARRRGGAARLRRARRRARRRTAARRHRAVRARRPRRPADERGHGRLARPRPGRRRSRRRASSSSPTCGRRRSRRRASARARASRRSSSSIVGTGASACLVVDGRPYAGARGEAIVLGAPPVEAVASGPALARAAGLERAEDVLADPAHAPLVDAAAAALGSVLAVLANALDPSLVVLGGGLGARAGVPGARRAGVSGAPRVPAHSAAPGRRLARSAPDGGVVGAALVALRTAVRLRARARRDRPLARRDGAPVVRSRQRSTTVPGSRRSRRCSAATAFAASSRAGTAPRTTSRSRCGSPRSRASRGPRGRRRAERPPRARRIRVAARATSCSSSRRPASSATWSRRSTPARPRRTRP